MRILGTLLLAAGVLPAAEFSNFIGDANRWQVSRLITDTAGNTYVAGSRAFNLSFDPLHPNFAAEAVVVKLDPSGKTAVFANLSGKGNDGATDVALDAAGNIYLVGRTSSPNFPLKNALFATPGLSFVAKFSPDGSQLLYSTYFPAPIDRLAVDAAGSAYVTGTTMSAVVPTTPGLPAGHPGGMAPLIYGAFLTKISPAGDRIVYSTVITGSNKPCGCCSSCFTGSRGASSTGVALDAAGNAYLAGNTDTTDLPVTAGVVQPNGIGPFVAKVNAAGTALSYLTYLGTGMQVVQPVLATVSSAQALAVDPAGNAYVVGWTWDPHLPVTPGAFQTSFHGWSDIDNLAPAPPHDAFAIKLNPSGTAVVWGSYLGGNSVDQASAAAVDSAGNLWVGGTTRSTGFPNAQGWSTGGDFVVEFNPTGTALPYSARYPDGTASQTLAIDSAGFLHLATASGVVSAVAPSAAPAVRPWIVANAAGGTPGGQIAPGEVISIYGPHIGAFPAVPATPNNGMFPTSLAGVQVLVNDVPAPLLYSSDSQINAVVPFEVAGQAAARIRVVNQSTTGPEFHAAVLPVDPQVFQNGTGAAALNPDGTINSPSNPAAPGSVLAIWATGVAPPFPAIGDGQIGAALDYRCCQIYPQSSSLGLYVPYAGVAPGLVAGLAQINFQLPATASGAFPVVLVSGGVASDAANVYVQP